MSPDPSHYDAYGPNATMNQSLFYNAAGGDAHPTKAFSDAMAARRVSAFQAMAAAALTGFALNGSTNTALKAMLARKTGRIVYKGDSTGAGIGASITTGGVSNTNAAQFADSRPYRPTAILAGLISGAGIPTLDNGFVGDAAGRLFGPISVTSYDTRVSFPGSAWTAAGAVAEGGLTAQSFAGASYFNGAGAGPLVFTPTTSVNTFELVVYNTGGTYTILIDGVAPATVTAPGCTVAGNAVTPPNTSTGFSKITVTAATPAIRALRVTPTGTPLLRSIIGYDTTSPAINILCHASAGANSNDTAAADKSWANLDALGYDAPDFTIIKIGLNDSNAGVSTATYAANLQKLIAKAKLSGDVLVLWANSANPSTFLSEALQDSYRDTAKAAAATAGVAFGDHRAAFGNWAVVGSRSADNTVHPNRAFYADIEAYDWLCIQAMVA